MAEIGWIDFSTRDRKKVQQIMSLIRPEGQLDELGVGYLRDSLANRLFPGISTIQTRAKYFFFIPNILRDYLKLPVKDRRHKSPKQYLKAQEHALKNKLREQYNFKEGIGIIGVTLPSSKYIKRNPSEIYWNGLQLFGFMNSDRLSLENYLRNAQSHQPLEKMQNEAEADDADSNYEDVFKIKTPVNNNWLQNLNIELEKTEAEYFRAQILNPSNLLDSSLLPSLFTNNELLQLFESADDFQDFVLKGADVPMQNDVRKLIILAYNFAEVIEGMHLLYNHLLQKHFFVEDYENKFEEEWMLWINNLRDKMIGFDDFDPEKVFSYTHTRRINTEVFVKQWWQLIRPSSNKSKPTDAMVKLVTQMERQSKPRKSRLSKPASANKDIDITLNKRIGLSVFQYRFFNARTIVNDINNSLKP